MATNLNVLTCAFKLATSARSWENRRAEVLDSTGSRLARR